MSGRRHLVWTCIAVLAFAIAMVGASATANAALTYVRNGPDHIAAGQLGSRRAPCPARMHVLGGGQFVSSAFGDAVLNASTPYDSKDLNQRPDDGWKSTVRNFNANNTLTVFAICSRRTPSYPGKTISVGPGRTAKTARRACPRGRLVTGGGVQLHANFADSGWIDSSAPFDSSDVNPRADDGWRATGGVEERKVHMTMHAICTDLGRQRARYVTAKASALPMTSGEASASCPGDTHVTGGGVDTDGVAFHPMTISSPFDDPTDPKPRPDDGWQGEFDNYSNSDTGVITTYAICLT